MLPSFISEWHMNQKIFPLCSFSYVMKHKSKSITDKLSRAIDYVWIRTVWLRVSGCVTGQFYILPASSDPPPPPHLQYYQGVELNVQ